MNLDLPAYFLADLPPDAPLTPTLIAEACPTLRRNRSRHLASRDTRQLIDLVSALASEWRVPEFPFRRLALEHGPSATGFSAATLAAGLDAFFTELTRENLEALVEQDLGHRERLDRFVSTPSEHQTRRTSLARGPQLLAHIASGNLPNPALMSIVLGFLTRSAQFVKCASGATLLPRLFAHSVYEADSRLGACLEIAEWKGGRTELESTLFGNVDCVTATGGDDMLEDIRSRLPARVRFLGYGHRLSFGYITRETLSGGGLRRIATRAAADVTAWDQLGCLSPHLFFVETGGAAPPEAFAQTLAEELAAREAIEPRGRIDTETAAAIASRRALYEIRAAASDTTRLWQSNGSTAWTVVYEAESGFQPSVLSRFVHVKPASDLAETLRVAEMVKGKVSTVGLEAIGDRGLALAAQLSAWGVTRICPLGRMQQPPPGWRHDGRPCLGDLVTWTDWEQ